jgi:hypothetical protein
MRPKVTKNFKNICLKSFVKFNPVAKEKTELDKSRSRLSREYLAYRELQATNEYLLD